MFHTFIYFKKVFDRVQHARLWQSSEASTTASSYSGIICQLQQWSPVEMSARGVLQDNSRHPSGMLTLTHPVQLVLREEHAGNIQWPPPSPLMKGPYTTCDLPTMSEETSPHLLLWAQDQRLGAGQDQLPCGSTETFSSNCQETESCTVRKCHTPRQPLQNHLSEHLGRWVTSWSAEVILDEQHQIIILSMPELLTRSSCRKDWKRISAESFPMSPRRPTHSRDWTEMNSRIWSPKDESDFVTCVSHWLVLEWPCAVDRTLRFYY